MILRLLASGKYEKALEELELYVPLIIVKSSTTMCYLTVSSTHQASSDSEKAVSRYDPTLAGEPVRLDRYDENLSREASY